MNFQSILQDYVARSLYGIGVEVSEVRLTGASIAGVSGLIPAEVCATMVDFLALPKGAKVYAARAAAKGLGLKVDWPEVCVSVSDGCSVSDKELDAFDAFSFAVRNYLGGFLRALSDRVQLICKATPAADQLMRSYKTREYEVEVWSLRNERVISPKWPLITVEYLASQIESENARVFGIRVLVKWDGKMIVSEEEPRVYSSNRQPVSLLGVARRLLMAANNELRLRRPTLKAAA